MSILRDHKHEGWVLAAYPDPKTSRPLIGAGFSLDVMATEHPQRDPLNPHPFMEPSSAQLWQAAGLEPDRLQRILDQFDRDQKAWGKKKFRKRIRTRALKPEVTEEEATSLLRISAIQAIYNARAYCRDFDDLTASQQMALSQLAFQMGVNLEEFVHFLGVMNGEGFSRDLSQTGMVKEIDSPRWATVQQSLIESQWARCYTGRATTVIAMFDPDYAQDPGGAERRVASILPPLKRPGRKRSGASLRVASYKRHAGGAHGRGALRSQRKRKLT
jgi:hypothetical protein